jgi:hypothetical protein
VLLALNVETVVPAIERTLHIQFLDKASTTSAICRRTCRAPT